jgi:hypothetical protein
MSMTGFARRPGTGYRFVLRDRLLFALTFIVLEHSLHASLIPAIGTLRASSEPDVKRDHNALIWRPT